MSEKHLLRAPDTQTGPETSHKHPTAPDTQHETPGQAPDTAPDIHRTPSTGHIGHLLGMSGDRADALSDSFFAFLKALPAWHRDALCPEYPHINWFPAQGEPAEPAKAICARCLVQPQCLSWALSHDELGIWGGTSTNERRAMRRRDLA